MIYFHNWPRFAEQLPEGVLLIDEQGVIRHANAALEGLTGYAREELVGRPVEVLVPQALAASHAQYRAEYLHRPQAQVMGAGLETDLRTRSGALQPVHVTLGPVGLDQGQCVVATVQDAGEDRRVARQLREALELRQRASGELETARRMKNAFVRAVSHELRTPLQSVLGFALTLERHYSELAGEKVKLLLGRLAHQAERLNRLLEDVLDFDRLARGTVQAQRRPTELVALVQRVIEATGPFDRVVRVEAAEPPVEVAVDASMVERTVEHLLVNAKRRTAPDGTLWVTVHLDDDGGALLTVEDDGPPVAEEVKPTVFDPFISGVAAAEEPSPDKGVGLALVAEFARLHDGRAWVEDTPAGTTRFCVHLAAGSEPCP